jgi:hypothetical protein
LQPIKVLKVNDGTFILATGIAKKFKIGGNISFQHHSIK